MRGISAGRLFGIVACSVLLNGCADPRPQTPQPQRAYLIPLAARDSDLVCAQTPMPEQPAPCMSIGYLRELVHTRNAN